MIPIKNWNWRTNRKQKNARSGSFSISLGLLQYRIYDAGWMGKDKFFTLTLQEKGGDAKLSGRWINAESFSMKEAFDELRELIKNNKWNSLDD